MSDPIDIANKLADALDAWDGKLMMPESWRTEAADTLRTQAAEITRLRAELAETHRLARDQFDLRAEQRDDRDRLRAALAQPAAVSADADDWLRERFGVVRGHPEWRALAEAFDAGKALAQPAAPAVTADDFFTLLGHAMALRMEGQTDMPAYFYGLAERIAPDAEHAARARQLAAAPQAPQPGERGA